MKEIIDIIHKSILPFFDVCEDGEEPQSDKDKLLLKVNKAICNNLKALEREPCGDLISREAVLNLIERMKPYHQDADDIIEMIQNFEPVNPQEPKWIPVSEKLPETDDDVLVYDGVDMFVAWYSLKGMWQGWNSSDNNFERDTPIIAWMPLPKPYESQESEEK